MADIVYDVCVIGAGIIGSCAAYNAIQHTKSVVLCEQVAWTNICIYMKFVTLRQLGMQCTGISCITIFSQCSALYSHRPTGKYGSFRGDLAGASKL